jgi:hypothetical protein
MQRLESCGRPDSILPLRCAGAAALIGFSS